MRVSMTTRKSGSNTDGRDNHGRFTTGNSGKPKGAKNRASLVALALFEGGVRDVATAVIEQARAGDLTAARIVLDKVLPNAKERTIALPDLPDTSTVTGVSRAQQAILEAVAAGTITPGEASTLSSVLEQRRKALETMELEQRLIALEEARDEPA